MTIQQLFAVLLIATLLGACVQDRGESIPDVSHIDISVNIQRFEQDLFRIDTNDVASGLQQLVQEYPDFAPFFFDRLLALERIKGDSLKYTTTIRSFLTHPGVRFLYDTCMVAYNDISGVEETLSDAFKRIRHYMPERAIPSVISCISEYTVGAFTYGDSTLVIGWDFFLGEDYPYYDPSIFPEYIQKTMARPYLPVRAVEAYLNMIIPPVEDQQLLPHIIRNGKRAYMVRRLLPAVPDSIIWGFSTEQMQWCKENEREIWAYLLNENLLYSTDINKVTKLINPAPNSPGMPPAAPGQTASYIGMKIVESYMNRQANAGFEDLIAETDAQTLLNRSKYKPRR